MTTGKFDADFAQFLDSMVNLDALDRMTRNLDDELKDSQLVMNQIKTMIDVLPHRVDNVKSEPESNEPRPEDILNFLSTDTPKLVMSDMDENPVDLDLDNVIATMKCYTENLKKKFTQAQTESQTQTEAKILPKLESLDLEKYASCLDQMCKRLSNLKLTQRDAVNKRDEELEAKLALLCGDANVFTQMVEAKTTLSGSNKSSCSTQQSIALDYDNLISKLLSTINEVSYLLQNKK